MRKDIFTLKEISWELEYDGRYVGKIGGDIEFIINIDFSLEIFIGSYEHDPQTKSCKSLIEAQGLAQHYLVEEALRYLDTNEHLIEDILRIKIVVKDGWNQTIYEKENYDYRSQVPTTGEYIIFDGDDMEKVTKVEWDWENRTVWVICEAFHRK